jgi:TRAP-type mannitol/chloroaromatic compound transport system permease small subunit
MNGLLKLSGYIDRGSERIGHGVLWLVLGAVAISAINATVRKAFDISSNAFLEIQWYLFAAVFLLGSAYTMLRQGHVKIDVVLGHFSRRTQVKVEMFGIVAFLFPFVFAVIDLVWPLVVQAYVSGESSENAGGLIRWPVYALLPAGFALLGLQGISELIKRIGFLKGLCADPALQSETRSAEEELAEEIKKHQVSAEVINMVNVADELAKDEQPKGDSK